VGRREVDLQLVFSGLSDIGEDIVTRRSDRTRSRSFCGAIVTSNDGRYVRFERDYQRNVSGVETGR
jgi:hypothetical protein